MSSKRLSLSPSSRNANLLWSEGCRRNRWLVGDPGEPIRRKVWPEEERIPLGSPRVAWEDAKGPAP